MKLRRDPPDPIAESPPDPDDFDSIDDVIPVWFWVYLWCSDNGGRWGRGRRYATHEMAQKQVEYYASIGVTACIEREYPHDPETGEPQG